MKTTLKEIREFAGYYYVTDITHMSNDDLYELDRKEGSFSTVAYSAGAYGCSGKILRGYNTGELYAITARTNAMFICS